jgi:hypothetical protein
MTDPNSQGPAERSAYANGYDDCRRKFEERPGFDNWHGKPLGQMSRGELIDALAWCVTELRALGSDPYDRIRELEAERDAWCHQSELQCRAREAEVGAIRAKTIEECAKIAIDPGFIEAQDTEWDEGVNYAKAFIAQAIRALA